MVISSFITHHKNGCDYFIAHFLCVRNEGHFSFWLCIDAAILSVLCCHQFVSIGSSVTILTSKSFSWCVTAFILEWVSVWLFMWVYAGVGGVYFTLTEGEHWLVWCWTSEEARHPLRLSVNVELTFEEVAMGEGTALWIFPGHKVIT